MSRCDDRPDAPRLRPWTVADRLLAAGVFLLTALHCWSQPHAIGLSDEGLFLYESKRVLEGQVLYRDVFELVTPLSKFLMAALFGLFGAGMATARGADAVTHGLIAAAVYGIARRLDARRGLAAAGALLHPAWFRPLWHMASPHWLSTLLTLGLLAELVRPPRGRPLVAGVWAGLIIAVQQQRGVPLALAAAVILAAEHWLDAGAPDLRRLAGRLAALAGGALLVVAPVGAYAVWRAGARPVFEALVVHPLVYYREQTHGVRWGAIFVPWAVRYAHPALLVWLPVLIVGQVVRAVAERRRGVARWRTSAILAAMALACTASILYVPDVVHIAFIAPVFAVLLVDQLEGALHLVRAARRRRALGAACAAALAAATVWQLRRVTVAAWRDYPVAYDSPFGRVQLPGAADVALRDRIRAVLADVPGRRLFIYPAGTAIYLETGAVNPTPFQIMSARYSRPEHFARVVETLERERTPYVLVTLDLPDDPLREYLARRYEVVPDVGPPRLLRRRDAAAASQPRGAAP